MSYFMHISCVGMVLHQEKAKAGLLTKRTSSNRSALPKLRGRSLSSLGSVYFGDGPAALSSDGAIGYSVPQLSASYSSRELYGQTLPASLPAQSPVSGPVCEGLDMQGLSIPSHQTGSFAEHDYSAISDDEEKGGEENDSSKDGREEGSSDDREDEDYCEEARGNNSGEWTAKARRDEHNNIV
eukprot:scaffold2039_cov17-Tisochrysis_lutea.AAC.1